MGSLATVDFFTANLLNAIFLPRIGGQWTPVSKGLLRRLSPLLYPFHTPMVWPIATLRKSEPSNQHSAISIQHSAPDLFCGEWRDKEAFASDVGLEMWRLNADG